MNHQAQHRDHSGRSGNGFIFANLGAPDTIADLAPGQGWGVTGKHRQQIICCLKGRVWVTQQGDIQDYLLDEGDAFLVTQSGLVMVRALGSARIGYREGATLAFKKRFRPIIYN